jgi:hypothetical protein
MKILIQDCKTLEFVNRDGTRTTCPIAAEDFGSTLSALHFCQKSNLSDLQILMKFARDEFDVRLPVSGACKEPSFA